MLRTIHGIHLLHRVNKGDNTMKSLKLKTLLATIALAAGGMASAQDQLY